MKKLIPADTVDAKNNVWETAGENIRKGAKEFSKDDVKAIVNILFPVGSVYSGENTFILAVGKWELLPGAGLGIISGGKGTVTGQFQQPGAERSTTGNVVLLRLWKRVN